MKKSHAALVSLAFFVLTGLCYGAIHYIGSLKSCSGEQEIGCFPIYIFLFILGVVFFVCGITALFRAILSESIINSKKIQIVTLVVFVLIIVGLFIYYR
jgi:hypothetical protein